MEEQDNRTTTLFLDEGGVVHDEESVILPEPKYVVVGDSDEEEEVGEEARHEPPSKSSCRPTVTFCGLDPTVTSSMVHRLYTVGASAYAAPPMKVGKPKPAAASNMCGMADNTSTATGYWCQANAPSTTTTTATTNASNSHHKTKDASSSRRQEESNTRASATPLQVPSAHPYVNSKKTFEHRVVSICQDLNHVAPDLVKRDIVLKFVKEAKHKQRQRRHPTSNNNGSSNNNKENQLPVSNIREAEDDDDDHDADNDNDDNTDDKDDGDGSHTSSEGYPSDFDDFLDYARHVVDNQNISFDEATYKDFESVLQESIRSHFLDDEDNDSLASFSTYTGYEESSKKHLEENSLISATSYKRVSNKIAHKKAPPPDPSQTLSKVVRQAPVHQVTVPKVTVPTKVTPKAAATPKTRPSVQVPTSEESKQSDDKDDSRTDNDDDDDDDDNATTNDPIAPLVVLSDDEKKSDCMAPASNLLDDDSVTTASTWADAIRLGKTEFKPMKKPSDRAANKATRKSSSRKSSTGSEECSTFGSFEVSALLRDFLLLSDPNALPAPTPKAKPKPNRTSIPADADSDSDDTASTAASRSILKPPQVSPVPLGPFMIRSDDNSIVSSTPYESRRRVRKRRYRKRMDAIEECPFPDDLSTVENIPEEPTVVIEQNILPKISKSQNPPPEDDRDERGSLIELMHQVAPEMMKTFMDNLNRKPFTTEDPPVHSITVDSAKKPTPSKQWQETATSQSPIAAGIKNNGSMDGMYWADNSLIRDDTSPGETSTDPDASKGHATTPSTNHVASPSQISLGELAASSVTSLSHVEQGAWGSPYLTPDENDVISRGSYWDDALDVQQEGSQAPTDVTDQDATQEKSVGPTKSDGSSFLDSMIEGYLVNKMGKLNSLVQERQDIVENKQAMHRELATVCLPGTDGGSPASDSSQRADTQRGKALIRKIQRKKKALFLARQKQRQSPPVAVPKPQSPVEIREVTLLESPTQLQSIAESPIEEAEPTIAESAVSVVSTGQSSVGSQVENTRSAILRVRARRKQVLKSQARGSNPPQPKRALYESADTYDCDEHSEDTVQTGSTISKQTSLQLQPMKFGILPHSNYSNLSEAESSFDASTDMSSVAYLEALAPPSPESPIRRSQLGNRSNDSIGADSIYLPEPRARLFMEAPKPKPRFALRVETKVSKVNDSFDDIVSRPLPHGVNCDDGFFNIHRKTSPTSIMDFFQEYEEHKAMTESLSFVDYGENDPVFVDDDDHDLSGGHNGFGVKFLSASQFEI